MPIFEYNGKKYNVRDEHIDSFMKDFPDASTIMEREGKKYRVKSADYRTFMSEQQQPEQSALDSTPETPVTPSAEEMPLTEQDKIRFSANIGQMKRRTEQMIDGFNERMETMREYHENAPLGGGQTAEGKMQFNPESGKLEKTYITPLGNRYTSKGLADMESFRYRQAADMSVNGQLRRAMLKLAELQEKREASAKRVHEQWEEDTKKNTAPLGFLLAADTYVPRQMSDKENSTLDVAIRQTEELIKDLEEQKDREQGVDVGFWRGFGRVAGDFRTWDFGMSDMRDALTMMNADDLKGENATEGEREAYNEMMGALYNKGQAEQMYGGNAGFWNRAGMMTGHMPAFMLDFGITGGGFKGINVLSKAGTKAATKVVGKETVEQMAKQGFKTYVKDNGVKGLGQYATNWTIKALGTTADDLLLRAPLMTNTVQAGKTTADIIDRKLGDVVVDENGNYDFSNDKTWGNAIWQGEANAIVENYSEMFGSHLDPVVTLGNMSKLANVGAKRIGAVLSKTDAGALDGIMGQTHQLFNKMGVSDYFGEVTEEYYGQLWRTMLNLDDAYQQNPDGTRTNLLATGQFHGDIWGGMALSMGLMGAGKATLSGVQYASMKHGVNKADARATELLGKEIWEPLRATIDLTTNDDIGSVAEGIVNDKDFSDDERAAILTYMERSLMMRGFNLGTLAQKRGGEQDEDVQSMNESYIDGYNLADPQEMTDAKNMRDYQRQRVSAIVDENTLGFLDIHPMNALEEMRNNGLWGESELETVIDYLNAKQVYDGMIQRVRDDIDARVEQSNAMVDARTNRTSGMIQGATMKQDDRRVYVVGGNLVQYADGSGIDNRASDGSIIVRDAETGALEQVSPDAVLNIDEPLNPSDEKMTAEEAIIQQFAQEASDKIDGVVTFNPGDTYTITGDDAQIQVQIVANEDGIVDNGDGTVNVSDGVNIFPLAKETIQQQADAANLARVAQFEQQRTIENAERKQEMQEAERPQYALNDIVSLTDENGVTVRGNITADADADGKYEVFTEAPINGKRVNLFTRDELDNMLLEHNGVAFEHPAENESNNGAENIPENDNNAPQNIPAMQRIPKDEQGNPLYEQADSDTAWDAIVEQTEGDEDMAQTVADGMVADKEEALKKLEKAKSKGGNSIAEKIASEKERKAAIDAAKQDLLAWQKIASTANRRRMAADAERKRMADEAAALRKAEEEKLRAEREEAERVEREALNGVPDMVDDTPQDARARGYRRVNGHKIDRQEPLQTVQGKEVNVKFSNDVLAPGHVAVIDASLLQPSHIQGVRNPLHFIDEAQPKERNDEASVLSARKIAGNIRPEEITSSITAYTGAPTVNERGEVIQGNNRSDALRLMWESHPEQAEAYRQYLKDHAEEFGLRAEDIAALQSPVLVNMLHVDDATAIPLGQYVAQDTESGGVERIKPKNALQRMGIEVRSFANLLLRASDDEVSFAGLVDANGASVLKWMSQRGFISPTQYKSAFDSKGNLTPESKNDLRGIMYQSIFKDGSTRLEEMFNVLPVKAQKAILATAFRDYDSPNSERMVDEIQNSVRAYYALSQDKMFVEAKNFKEARTAVESWKRQYQMDDVTGESYLPADNFSNFVLHLAAMYKGESQSFIQNTFGKIYDLIQGTQEETLFEQPDNTPRTLVQAIKEALNLDYNGQQRSNVLVGDTATSQRGQQGSNGTLAPRERVENGNGTTDDTGRTESIGGQSEIESSLSQEEMLSSDDTDNQLSAKIARRIEVQEDDWIESGKYGDTYKQTIIVDGTHKVIKVDAPDTKGNYIGSAYEYDGQTFGDLLDVLNYIDASLSLANAVAVAEKETDTTPTEKQKEAGNYKKGHVQVGTFNITIENPKGSVRSGIDTEGNKWETIMQNTYGYIRGTEGVDGDHIDVFLSDDIDGWNGRRVFVVDQYNEDGSFDEHKVMLGFNETDDAEAAYFANYDSDWANNHKTVVTAVNLEDFEKWIDSSHRKTKAFAEYKSVKSVEEQSSGTQVDRLSEIKSRIEELHKEQEAAHVQSDIFEEARIISEINDLFAEQRKLEQSNSNEETTTPTDAAYTITPAQYTTKRGKVLDMHLVEFNNELRDTVRKHTTMFAKQLKGWWDKEKQGFMMRSKEDAERLAEYATDAQSQPPLSLSDLSEVNDGNVQFSEPQQQKATKNEKKAVNSRNQTGGLFGDLLTENDKADAELHRQFAMTVKADMLAALDNGTKPYRSILDLRKRASELGMEVDNDGRTDILLQELVEDGLVRAAREVIERKGSASRESYDLICKLYEMQPTISARSSNRIKMQQYSTPLPMAWIAGRFAMADKADGSVLEPTAGNGMLVFTIPVGQVHVNELDKTRLDNLREQGFAQVTQQDATEPFDGDVRYDVVIANPPFGKREAVEYDGKKIPGLDPQITLNALSSMKDDGRAAIIIGGNMEYANNGAIKSMKPFFTYLYDHYNVKGVIDMGGGLYAKQGTTFPTRMILIDGRRTNEERAQTAVYPPVENKAIRKAESFDDLYEIINEVLNFNEKTNGTEVLRSQGGRHLSVADNASGETDGAGHNRQSEADDESGSQTERRGRTGLEGNSESGQRPVLGKRGQNDTVGETGRGTDTIGKPSTDGRGLEQRTVGNEPQPVDGVDVQRIGLGLKGKPKKRDLTEEKLPYRPHNTAFRLESVAPAAMVEAMDKVLSQIEAQHGSIDEFVKTELGYDTIAETYQALAAEQMDSVAMAIYQMKQEQALIIGDQTGVGKGRQMAALIRWAVQRGEKPVFITQKADLFSDIYRDLVDVGSGDLVPFIFNSDGAMVDSKGNTVHKPLSSAEMAKVFASGALPEEYDFAVLTYSQVNTGDAVSQQEMEEAAKKSGARTKKSKNVKNGKATPKATFLRAIAKDNYLFLDESHTAAGSSNTGAYLQSILRGAKAATFASATFAKRPDTMPLYAIRTAMSQAKVDPDKMISIIEKGGVTLQEIMSRELTNAGQMVRRERDMSDVVTDWKTITDPETVRRARENYDRTIAAFNAIIKFQEDYVKPMIEALDMELAVMAESAGVKRGTDKMGVENVPFASKTYNYTKQLMLALKVNAIADEVEGEINAGRHPVIALESTMESSIKDYAAGEIIDEPTFSASLLKGLDTVMQYTVKDEDGNERHERYSPQALGPAGEKAYYELQDFIRESTSDIFISPLDAIIERLNKKGYKVGELTGRNMYVERNDDGRVVVKRRTDKDKKKMQREFNSGVLDVLILNKSASTGISLHASEKFSDQRQRSMIIAQPLSDINDYMQMIGRIDRTGQVHRGYYINLGLPVPAENRFLMMLSTKLKSLNANTTTSQDSESNDVEAPDLLNKYGSQVVVEYLRDNVDIYEKMGTPLKKGGLGGGRVQASELEDYKPQEDDARKITGYVALLATKEQEEFYDDVVRRYNELIKYLNDTGSNDLKITVMPLRATTIEKRISSEGIDPDGNNPFARNSFVEKVEMDVLRKPMKADEIRKVIEQINKGVEPNTYLDNVIETIRKEDEVRIAAEDERYEKSKAKAIDDIAKQTEKINGQKKRSDEEKRVAIDNFIAETNEKVEAKHKDNILRLNTNSDQMMRRLRMFEVGKSYLVPDNLESMIFDFATSAIFCGYKTKDSKITASTTLAVFATLDGRRRIEIKLSQIDALRSIDKVTNDNWDAARATTLDNWDSQIPSETRKTGFIMTGNILQAIADTQDEYGGYPGQLISYTDIDGNVHDGILMPDKWNASMLKTSGAPLSSRLQQIKDYTPITSHDGKVEIMGNSWAKMFYLTVPKTKKDGAVYYENKTLLRAAGGNFYPYRGKLRADIPEERIIEVVKELAKLGVKVKDDTTDILQRNGIGAYNDDEVSYENDPVAKLLGQSRRTAKQRREFARRERQRMAERVESLAEKLHLDNVEVVTDASVLDGKKQRAKGFYSKSTGKITIVIPNHTSTFDVEQTLLHEAVAHYGLRQLFGEHFDTFLDNVFNNADENIRRRIVDMAAKNGWDFHKATEEYLASLAEDTEFENINASWWQQIKDFFLNMLHKIGFEDFRGVTLSDNELRYILWRSYENLAEPGRYRNILGEAADVAKQYELKVGNYAVSDPHHQTVAESDDALYRTGDPEIHERELARDRYERRVKSGMFQSQEALQDSMLGLKEAMTAILGKETNIEDVDGFENAYLGENRLSSVNKAEADAFAHTLFKPMLDEVAKLARTEAEREELTDYMMAKHGLERNTYMRNEAINNGATDADQTDYAGLTALTGMDNVADAETEAQIMVNDYEQAHDTTDLWKKVNAASKAILSKSYECGMMSKATFDKISDMYDFYIPLRGFDEKTSSEAYAYLTHKQSAFNAPIKKAEGRRSKADDPFANLQSMAEGAIMQGNRNKLVKQRFLNFALNHPSDLVSVSDIWVEYDTVADEWKPVFPDNIDSTDTPEVVERKMLDFETKMESLAQQYPDRYKHGKDTVNIPYRIVESRDMRQHQIVVKRGGRDYVITINGNPRAAQALNGQTNPDNDMSGAIGAILRAGENINRQLSAFYTTRNPDFIVSNFMRDMLYTNTMTWIRESPNYALRFHRNYMYANPVRIKQLLAKHRKGTLDMSNKTEAMFHQFMMNGGETGYANIRDIEQHKNDIRRELKKSNGKIPVKKAWDLLGGRFDEYNRAVENCARFAAFMTSREMGRSIDRAIYDAKEISVNFNKKGSGAKFYDSTGQTKAGNASALVSGLGRSGYVFWNAAIQGTANFGRQMKRHPAKAFTGIAAMFLLGAIVAYLGGDDDDDDDKNAYYNLPEYVRRSNILFRAGNSWVSIPLPVEYRAVYGMGELMISVLNGKEHLTDGEIAEAITGQATQILPIDFLEGGGGLNAFVPSAYKPLWEAYVAEKSWTGMPLYKDTPYNKDMPEWTKAYKSANKYIVGLANAMNEATGGDPYTKGTIDFNPAKIEYMLNGYFGGVFGTIDKLSKMVETVTGNREYDPRSFLLANRLVKAGDERTEYRAVNNEYFRLKEEHDRLKSRLKHYEEDTDNDIFDYAEKIDFLYNSPEYERYEIFEDYREDIDDLYNELKEAISDEERKDIEAELNELKKEMIEEMNKTRK